MTNAFAPLEPPAAVVEIARTLVNAGFETWCVGGAVRDGLLGLRHLDWDLATAATPAEVRRLFRRTIAVGIEFGTIGVFDRAGTMHEVTTFRRDVQTDGRHAVVEFGASLDEDLARRDFTINAIAYDPLGHRLHDPFGGRDDLDRRIVRAVGIADERMREDRLRALRAIRFAARFDFDIEPDTWTAIANSAPFLSRLSAERVKQEIEKTIEQVRCPSVAFRRWRDAGALAQLIPALASISDVTLEISDYLAPPVLTAKPYRRTLRVAGLFSALEAADAERALKALRFSNHDTALVSTLVARWRELGQPMSDALAANNVPPVTLRRWAARIGRLRITLFMRLASACWSAQRARELPAPAPNAVRQTHRALLHAAFHEPIELADLAIDGDDLRSAGIPPGRHLGALLTELLERVLQDPAMNRRELLLEHALTLHASNGTA